MKKGGKTGEGRGGTLHNRHGGLHRGGEKGKVDAHVGLTVEESGRGGYGGSAGR